MNTIENGMCPKCHYMLVKLSLKAKCARCDFETSWEEYNNYWAQLNGFNNYSDYISFTNAHKFN